jgi:hypothetical protein
MQSSRLNEHDAHQGAQSSGEFLGMSGNSGWYLLGSAGLTLMMVVFLWGVLGVSLLLCLLVGLVLCGMSLAYVLMLKNNRPEHYDTDFFESALVEAGVLPFVFGPRTKPAINPFQPGDVAVLDVARVQASGRAAAYRSSPRSVTRAPRTSPFRAPVAVADRDASADPKVPPKDDTEPRESVSMRDYEHLQEQLASTEEQLEEAYAEGGRRDL